MASQLKLTVLVDNNTLTDRYYQGEPGLSFFLETGKKKILFDTGYSSLFLKNAGAMGIGMHNLNFVVLSHGHLDHSGGLAPLIRHFTEGIIEGKKHSEPKLIAHPWCFLPKEKLPLHNNGSIICEEELSRHFRMNLSDTPVWITKNLVFLGKIPRTFSFENTNPGKRRLYLPDGKIEPDYLIDDTALAYRSDSGIVIITGCSHSGICNIIESST